MVIGTVFSVLTLVSALIALIMHASAHVLLTRDKRLPQGKLPISILRPLKGSIEALEQNLESLCQQNYPSYEIIVTAADADDPALTIARRVRDKYPNVPFRVYTGEWPTGLNPKVRLLRRMFAQARHNGILISDDNVCVRYDYLSVMAGALAKSNTGLVSNLVVGVGGRTVGAICENLQLNTFVLSSVAASSIFNYPVVIGKSMLFRRDALLNAGGFAAFADVLAEDHLLGRAVRAAGYKVAVLGFPVYTVNVDWSLSRTLGRHLRWCKIRSSVAPWLFPFELLVQPTLLFLLTLTVTGFIERSVINGWLFGGGLAVLLATLSEIGLIWRIQGRSFRAKDVLLLPLRTVIALVAHIGSGFVKVVHWRNEAFRVGKDSLLTPVVRPAECERRMTFDRAA